MWRSKKKIDQARSCSVEEEDDDHQGLKILIKIADETDSKAVVKPVLGLSLNSHRPGSFLESCHLCRKQLSLDKEVFMYRGDLGFCSVECRERQMYVDEMEEIEISTKKILVSFQRRRPGGGRGSRCEASGLSEEFRRRRLAFSSKSSSRNSPVIFS